MDLTMISFIFPPSNIKGFLFINGTVFILGGRDLIFIHNVD